MGHDFNVYQAMAILLVIGVAIGALSMWLIPMAWHWIKPFIHALTA